MISNKYIVDAANTKIAAGNLTELEVTQLSSIQKSLETSVYSVNVLGDLPLAANNTGRMIYVTSLGKYYFSNGLEWLSDYSSVYDVKYFAISTGRNTWGELGDGTTANRSSPVSVVGGIERWAAISAGSYATLGLTNGSIAYGWGRNNYGRLGDGTTTSRSSPVSVIGNIAWSQIAIGHHHSVGVSTSGVAYAWGWNGKGQLGDGTITTRSSPVSVIGGITDWKQLSAGGSGTAGGRATTVGVTNSGIAYGWGANALGQIGDDTTTDKSSPVSVAGGITNWTQVSIGDSHCLGVTTSGIAYAWGDAGQGRLGDGTTTNRSSPVSVIGGITNWKQVSAGLTHSLGVTESGVAYGWGNNSGSRLGDGTTTNRSSPVSVIGGITNWKQVSAGGNHSLGVTTSGSTYGWGENTNGELGTSNIISYSSPTTNVVSNTSWSQVSAGRNHSVLLKSVTKGF